MEKWEASRKVLISYLIEIVIKVLKSYCSKLFPEYENTEKNRELISKFLSKII